MFDILPLCYIRPVKASRNSPTPEGWKVWLGWSKNPNQQQNRVHATAGATADGAAQDRDSYDIRIKCLFISLFDGHLPDGYILPQYQSMQLGYYQQRDKWDLRYMIVIAPNPVNISSRGSEGDLNTGLTFI